MKKSRKHPQAERDIAGAVVCYAGDSIETAERFLRELEDAVRRIERMPGTGSLRYARDLDMPGLRAHLLGGFPYVLFYFERDGHADLVRVLHTHRDIFTLLLEIG
mgnify:CR=1 FL=1